MANSPWAGSDFQLPPQPESPVALCGACRRLGACRLGLGREELQPDGSVHTDLVCGPENEGGPDVAHGGWTAEVLDEVCGHVPLLKNQMSVTATLTIQFIKPVPLRHPLEAVAWVESVEGRNWNIAGELRLASSGAPLASASGVWVARDKESHFAGFERWLAEQT